MPSFEIVTDKRVCFWGASQGVSSQTRTYDRLLIESGQNTGNLFIGGGLFSALRAPKRQYWDFYDKSPAEFDELFDVLFVPASNFVFENTDLKDQYDFFSKTKAQIFMFGLGSQVKEVKPVKLKEGTERFLRLVADRSEAIGVRGETTAEIMAQMGFKTVSIVGCPSMLRIPSTYKDAPELHPATILAGNFTNNGRQHSFDAEKMAAVESLLFKELMERGGYYVLQNERHEIISLLTSPLKALLSGEEIFHLQTTQSLFGIDDDYSSMAAYLVRRAKLFWERDEWIRFMSGVDLSFGTRFHGNVAAILAGTPVFVICHDFRTLELCQLYKIPHCRLEDATYIRSIADIAARSSMSSFAQNFSAMCEIWTSFASRNGFGSSVDSGK